MQANGNTIISALGADKNLYLDWQDSSTNQWSGWASLGSGGGGFTTTPSLIVQANGNTVITAIGVDKNLYLDWQDSSTNQWSGWANLGSGGGGFLTTPSMIVQANGNTIITAIGVDKNLYLDWQDSSTNQWSGWANLGSGGGGFRTTPSMVVQLNGNTVMTVIGADKNLYLNWQDSATDEWSGWANLGSGAAGFLSASSMIVQGLETTSGPPVETTTTTGPLVPQPPPSSAPAPAPPSPVSGSVIDCNDISGNWFDSAGNAFILNQTGSSVSGYTNEYDEACGTVSWTITGQATGPNTFTLTEYNPTPSVDSCGHPVEQQETANVVINSCQQAQEFFVSGSGSASRFASLRLGGAQSSTGNLWNRTSALPELDVTVDIMKDTVTTTVTGQNKTDNLSVVIQDSNGQTTTLATHNNVGSTSFSDSLKRTSLAVGQYGTVTATWGGLTKSVPVSFYVIGNTRFSQYNVPYESQCPANPQRAWIVYKIDSNYCYYESALMGSQFISQTQKNGTGVSSGYGVLKAYYAGARNICSPGANDDGSHTFFAVDTGGKSITKITGTCNKILSDGTGLTNPLVNNNPPAGTLATYPVDSRYVCSDQIMMVDAGSDTYDLRMVQDSCPGCGPGSYGGTAWPGTVAHIDTFNSSETCNPSAIGDYGNRVAIRLR